MAKGFGSFTLTTYGLNLISKAQAGAELKFTRVAVGDGILSGQDVTALKHLLNEVISVSISALIFSGSGTFTVASVLSNENLTTGFYWREIGLFATDPQLGEILYGYANAADGEIYVPDKDTSIFSSPCNIKIAVSNVANVTAIIDSNLVWATEKEISDIISGNIICGNAEKLDGKNASDFATAEQGQKADAALPATSYTATDVLNKVKMVDGSGSGLDADTLDGKEAIDFSPAVIETAKGSSTAIMLTTLLTDGYSKNFIASSANGGAATTVNGKPLYKPNSTLAPNLIAGKGYTIWYSASGDCFFLKTSAEGNAGAADVRKGKIFSNDNDTSIVGDLDLSLLTPDNLRKDITIDGVTGSKLVYGAGDIVKDYNMTLQNAIGTITGWSRTDFVGLYSGAYGDNFCTFGDFIYVIDKIETYPFNKYTLYKIRKSDGSTVWSTVLYPAINYALLSGLYVDSDSVYVVSSDNSTSAGRWLYRVSQLDGSIIWSNGTTVKYTDISGNERISSDADCLYIATNNVSTLKIKKVKKSDASVVWTLSSSSSGEGILDITAENTETYYYTLSAYRIAKRNKSDGAISISSTQYNAGYVDMSYGRIKEDSNYLYFYLPYPSVGYAACAKLKKSDLSFVNGPNGKSVPAASGGIDLFFNSHWYYISIYVFDVNTGAYKKDGSFGNYTVGIDEEVGYGIVGNTTLCQKNAIEYFKVLA